MPRPRMNLVLVEDHPELRATFAELLATSPRHRLVAAYASAEDAMAGLVAAAPGLVIVDLDLPGTSGVQLIQWMGKALPDVPAVVWTIHEGRDVVYAALKAGALGYLVKSLDPAELRAALEEIEGGGAPMSPRIARRLLRDLVDGVPAPSPGDALTLRERDVLRAVARGESHKDIADGLGMSANTVHSHLKHIYKKLHARGRAEALARAQELGLIVRR